MQRVHKLILPGEPRRNVLQRHQHGGERRSHHCALLRHRQFERPGAEVGQFVAIAGDCQEFDAALPEEFSYLQDLRGMP